MLDVEEYAKQKGIPVGAIPVEAFKKIQTEGVTLRQVQGDSKAEAFKMLCADTKELLEKCGAAEGGVSSFLLLLVLFHYFIEHLSIRFFNLLRDCSTFLRLLHGQFGSNEVGIWISRCLRRFGCQAYGMLVQQERNGI
jgi:hypothetical protein